MNHKIALGLLALIMTALPQTTRAEPQVVFECGSPTEGAINFALARILPGEDPNFMSGGYFLMPLQGSQAPVPIVLVEDSRGRVTNTRAVTHYSHTLRNQFGARGFVQFNIRWSDRDRTRSTSAIFNINVDAPRATTGGSRANYLCRRPTVPAPRQVH